MKLTLENTIPESSQDFHLQIITHTDGKITILVPLYLDEGQYNLTLSAKYGNTARDYGIIQVSVLSM